MRDFDSIGAGFLIVGNALVLFVVIQGSATQWTPYTYSVAIVGIFFLAAFFYAEKYATRPLIPPQLWRTKGFAPLIVCFGLSFGSWCECFLNSCYTSDDVSVKKRVLLILRFQWAHGGLTPCRCFCLSSIVHHFKHPSILSLQLSSEFSPSTWFRSQCIALPASGSLALACWRTLCRLRCSYPSLQQQGMSQ